MAASLVRFSCPGPRPSFDLGFSSLPNQFWEGSVAIASVYTCIIVHFFLDLLLVAFCLPPSSLTGCSTCAPPSLCGVWCGEQTAPCNTEDPCLRVLQGLRPPENWLCHQWAFYFHYCSYPRHRSVPPLSLISTDSNTQQGKVNPRGGWKLGHIVSDKWCSNRHAP